MPSYSFELFQGCVKLAFLLASKAVVATFSLQRIMSTSSSSFTSKGTSTIASSLRARGMPNMDYNQRSKGSSASTTPSGHRKSAGRDRRRESISRDSESFADLQSNNVCCIHGLPCGHPDFDVSDPSPSLISNRLCYFRVL